MQVSLWEFIEQILIELSLMIVSPLLIWLVKYALIMFCTI